MNLHETVGDDSPLHPQQVVTAMVAKYMEAFARLSGTLDLAIQDAYARVEDRHDEDNFPGCVVSPLVRDAFLDIADKGAFRDEGIEVVEKGNKGIRLRTREGQMLKVRKHPLDFKQAVLLAVTPPAETLFGPAKLPPEYELVALWVPDRKTQTLASVSLSAVTDLDDGPRTRIFAAERLPTKSLYAQSASDAEERTEKTFGWDDEFGSGEGSGDTSV